MDIKSVIIAGLIVVFLNGLLIIMSTIVHRRNWRKHRYINVASLALFLSVGSLYYEYETLSLGNHSIALTFLTYFLFSFSISIFVKSLSSLYSTRTLINIKYNFLIAALFAALITVTSYYGFYTVKFFLYYSSILMPTTLIIVYIKKRGLKLHTNIFFYLSIFLCLVTLHNVAYVAVNHIDVDYINIQKRVFTWIMVSIVTIDMIYVAYIIEQNVIDLLKTQGSYQLLQELHNKVKKASETDYLTKLYNRFKITKILEQLKSMNTEFSVLICDVNSFKDINDRFGHMIGDEALVFIAQSLENIVRVDDIVGRWGGDEFLIILPNTSLELSEKVRVKILNYFDKEIFAKVSQTLSISVGKSAFNHTSSISEIINQADMNMYDDKLKYRNSIKKNM